MAAKSLKSCYLWESVDHGTTVSKVRKEPKNCCLRNAVVQKIQIYVKSGAQEDQGKMSEEKTDDDNE